MGSDVASRMDLLGRGIPLTWVGSQANFHTTLSGESMVTLVYHKKLTEEWEEAAQKLRAVLGACPSSRAPLTTIVGRSYKQKIHLDTDFVTETLLVGASVLPREILVFCLLRVSSEIHQCCLNGSVCSRRQPYRRLVARL